MPLTPQFTISSATAQALMRIEAAKQSVDYLPITPSVLATLRETARLYSMHYSMMIEGNRLTQEEVVQVVEQHEHFPGRDRDEKEVLGYYAALEKVEKFVAVGGVISSAKTRFPFSDTTKEHRSPVVGNFHSVER